MLFWSSAGCLPWHAVLHSCSYTGLPQAVVLKHCCSMGSPEAIVATRQTAAAELHRLQLPSGHIHLFQLGLLLLRLQVQIRCSSAVLYVLHVSSLHHHGPQLQIPCSGSWRTSPPSLTLASMRVSPTFSHSHNCYTALQPFNCYPGCTTNISHQAQLQSALGPWSTAAVGSLISKATPSAPTATRALPPQQ